MGKLRTPATLSGFQRLRIHLKPKPLVFRAVRPCVTGASGPLTAGLSPLLAHAIAG